DLLSVTPPAGLGLNPVLRDGGMLIHPPVILAGFASFAIPFSFACAALLAGRADAAWIAHTRRFALLAWSLQTTGLLLGMWWAYHVLGWGGYWGWDPVENVALMPWLATTAYLHSAQVQEKRGRMRAWNFGLVILAFLLVVFGTFIVRSGVVPSVHTFAISAIGPWFLGFLGICIVFSVALLAFRAAAPLLAVLLALMAAGPLLPWRRAGRPTLRALRWSVAAAMIVAIGLIAFGVRSLPALIAAPLATAAAATVLTEYGRAMLKRP